MKLSIVSVNLIIIYNILYKYKYNILHIFIIRDSRKSRGGTLMGVEESTNIYLSSINEQKPEKKIFFLSFTTLFLKSMNRNSLFMSFNYMCYRFIDQLSVLALQIPKVILNSLFQKPPKNAKEWKWKHILFL